MNVIKFLLHYVICIIVAIVFLIQIHRNLNSHNRNICYLKINNLS